MPFILPGDAVYVLEQTPTSVVLGDTKTGEIKQVLTQTLVNPKAELVAKLKEYARLEGKEQK